MGGIGVLASMGGGLLLRPGHQWSRQCVLWIESLGVHEVPLPPLAPRSLWRQITRHLDTLTVPLRAWLARIGLH